jgi:hypothetical protein
MRNNSGIVCNSKAAAAATAALETIAGTFPKGTQRDAIIAVIIWIEENISPNFDEETRKRIQSIYDEAAQKAIEWEVRGGEPKHGTRAQVPFLFNAETKTWELEEEMPPAWTEPNTNILEKTEGYDGRDEYEK